MMNVIWIVADTFRRDHIGAYGNPTIRTPSLDALAAGAVRFDRHYSAGFPTMPTRADHQTGRWTMSFMGWQPLPAEVTTLAEILVGHGLHTAAAVDTPYYLRDGMNYDRGFQSFFMNRGQDTLWSMIPQPGYHHESLDVREAWRYESDRNAPSTFMTAIRWLRRHYKENFFLYVDTWDPHEPWDAPPYYTELYWPDYDGELVLPLYGNWHDVPGYEQATLRKGHATYHGFYFGEHGGLFGKMNPSLTTRLQLTQRPRKLAPSQSASVSCCFLVPSISPCATSADGHEVSLRRLKTDTSPIYPKSSPDHPLPLPLIAHSAAVTSALRWIRVKSKRVWLRRWLRAGSC